MKRGVLDLPDIRLAYVDFGGEGPGVLLLHGLFGRATTWTETARWLTPHCHVIGLDQRGHGWSDKPDNAYTRDAYVRDAAAAIERMNLGPAFVIGHSMGALNAWVLAARRPDLVRALVLEDMGAATATRAMQDAYRRWLAEWPLPFGSLAEVRAYFGRVWPATGDYFAEVMAEAADGYRPLFQPEHMLQSAGDWDTHSYWEELEAVRCPALVVRGGAGDLPRDELEEMARRVPNGRFQEVAGAGHVVHYDRPEGWRAVVEPFALEVMASA